MDQVSESARRRRRRSESLRLAFEYEQRPLRRYLRLWKIERLFAWLKNFRCLTSRWERRATKFLAMVHSLAR